MIDKRICNGDDVTLTTLIVSSAGHADLSHCVCAYL